MFHTMVIQQQIISDAEWKRIYNNLDKLSEVKGCNLYRLDAECTEKITVYKTLCLADKGLNQITLKKIKVDRKYTQELKYIEIVLNPSKLLKKINSIAITKEEDIENMYEAFEKVKILIDSNLNRLYLWTLKRSDYARNIDMRNVEDWVTEDKEQLVSEYIKLFKKADKPSKMKIPYNESHRRSQRPGSFRLYNKSVTVNFYDKENERINKDKPIEDSKYILRLEIQCNKFKTNAIKRQNEWDSKMLFNYLNKDIALKNLHSYYNKTVGEGDYYKLKGAETKIRDSKYRSNKQEILISMLKSINKTRSIWRAREESEFSKEKFNGYLRDIRRIGVNPVTISERVKFDYLPNVWWIEDSEI